MRPLRYIINAVIIIILTIITQIGGLIWWLNLFIRPYLPKKRKFLFELSSFVIMYLLFTFLLIPPIATQFGRTPLPISKNLDLAPHSYFTVLLNRHYVTPILKNELLQVSTRFGKSNPNMKTIYLDANFPFFDGFPLLPHLSHDDGKKIDLSFLYIKDGKSSNEKPSRSGYGYYENPKKGETNQPQSCLLNGYWQYDFPKYLTLGSNTELVFDSKKTKELIELILKRKNTQKVFLEPHLKARLKLNHSKLRYHGCRAVRHDDHIHYQIK